ncbi:MAG: EF2563 family selenium-dependent molybdenum hydroxylase system protein [Deltaproteobacteria bacterium]|nr:EF2563 family selenium-dependent molybdenum hydroxylase system protein [Deltaproteobacteria bacterium]
MFEDKMILIRGAGDLATGVAARLWRSGFPVIMTEIERPLTVRRSVSLSEAVFEGEVTVEDIIARFIDAPNRIKEVLGKGKIPVLVDPDAAILNEIELFALVDAIMAKRNLGTRMDSATFVIGLGPGFTAGKDVHAVVETKRGHNLGRVIRDGEAEPDTGIPGEINGHSVKRLIRSPGEGIFSASLMIGDSVKEGAIVGYVENVPVKAPLTGVLRGLIHEGISVKQNMKIGDIDPRGIREYCHTISDKALAIGGGVLEALLMKLK